jgi:hypothetical protein
VPGHRGGTSGKPSRGRRGAACCGEGADAIWLAGRGWQVTAADVSTVAITRGASHAAKAGDDIAALLDPGEWDVLVNAARPHPAADPEGRPVTAHDTVLRARRHDTP